MLGCGTCQRRTRPLSAPLAHQGSVSAAGHLDTASSLSRCSCLPVWVMNVYFTYRLSVCGLNGCHISNPSKIRTMCCHCNLKHPRGFFFSFGFGLVLVFPFALLSSYLTPKTPDFDFSLPALTSLSLCLTAAASKFLLGVDNNWMQTEIMGVYSGNACGFSVRACAHVLSLGQAGFFFQQQR